MRSSLRYRSRFVLASGVASPALVMLAMLVLAGCGDPQGLLVDMRWQVKCAGTSGCLSSEHPPHDFFDFAPGVAELPADNPQPFTARCTLTELDSGDLLWSFRGATSSYSFSVRNAQIPAGGGNVTGDSCRVVVVDDINTYEGRCGSAPLSAEQPCRFTSVGLTNSEVIPDFPGRTLSTTVECEDIPNQVLASQTRDLRAPGNDASAAPINLMNCEGFPF